MVFKSKFPPIIESNDDILEALFSSSAERDRKEDKPAFVDVLTGDSITFRQLKDSILHFGAGLQDACQFKKGDVLALYSPNTWDYAVPLVGTLAAGGAVSPANPSYTATELAYQLTESKATVLIAHAANVENAIKAAESVGIAKSKIFVFGDHSVNGIPSYRNVLLGDRRIAPIRPSNTEDTVSYLCFSSGTTGKSKGVMTTHKNIVYNIRQALAIEGQHYASDDDRVLGVLPFFHMYGLTMCLHVPIYSRTTIYVLPRFDLVQFCETVQKNKITYACLVPPILLLLAKEPVIDKYDLSSLKVVVAGAAPLDAGLTRAVKQRMPQVTIKQGYGLTETSPLVCLHPADQVRDGSSGLLVPNTEAKIVDENGNEVGIGERGELWFKGPNVMKGYINRPEETARVIDANGYFHTGDVAVIDKDGHIYIVDRIKELIKYKGFQVAPAELEAILLKNPSVADCAVIGVYDNERATELPRAYVALKPGVPRSEATVADLKQFVAKQVARYKQIHSVVFVDQIPKSATGKILRNILREAAKRERQSKL